MKPRNAYITALDAHRTSTETKPLRDAGYGLADWTSGTCWQLGNPEELCWLIASERDGIGGNDPHEGDWDNVADQLATMRLDRCYVVRVTGGGEMQDLAHNYTLADAMLLVSTDAAFIAAEGKE
jgi:hypothetical protein